MRPAKIRRSWSCNNMKRIPYINSLLAALPRKNQQQFIDRCEYVDLAVDEVLYNPGDPIRYIYFPTDGYISVIGQVDTNSTLEVALVGNEGMIGIAPTLGISDSMLHVLVQGDGTALRMKTAFFSSGIAEQTDFAKNTQPLYLYSIEPNHTNSRLHTISRY